MIFWVSIFFVIILFPRSLMTIFGGTQPAGVVVSRDGRYVYVTYGGVFTNYSVSVVDAVTNAVTVDIPVGIRPGGVAVSPDGRHVYVTAYYSDDMVVIDAATNAITTTIPIPTGFKSRELAVSPDGRHVYVGHSDGVLVIDAATYAIITTIPTKTLPLDLAVSPDGRRIYVTSYSNGVLVIDTATNTIAATILVGTRPHGVAVSPDGRTVYVANSGDPDPLRDPINSLPTSLATYGSVSVIDVATNTITTTIPTGAASFDVAVSPDGRHVYVTNTGGLVNTALIVSVPGSVSVIDTVTGAVATTFGAGGNLPNVVAVSPDGRRIYIANGDSDRVSVIDTATNTIIASISSGHYGLIRYLPTEGGSEPAAPPRPVKPPAHPDPTPGHGPGG